MLDSGIAFIVPVFASSPVANAVRRIDARELNCQPALNSRFARRQPEYQPHIWLLLSCFACRVFGTCPRHTTSSRRRTPHTKARLHRRRLAFEMHIVVMESATEGSVEFVLEF